LLFSPGAISVRAISSTIPGDFSISTPIAVGFDWNSCVFFDWQNPPCRRAHAEPLFLSFLPVWPLLLLFCGNAVLSSSLCNSSAAKASCLRPFPDCNLLAGESLAVVKRFPSSLVLLLLVLVFFEYPIWD
jgi:hypothetical protein